MSAATRVTITAGVATLLGAIPLAGGFAQQRWFFYAALAVAVVIAVGVFLRFLRLPALVVLPAQFAGLLVFHTVVFARSDGWWHVIPNSDTISDLLTSVSDGMHDIQYLAAPVPARTDIVVLTAFAVGLLAIAVDVIAVSAQRPAVAGLALLALFAIATAVSARTLFFEFAGAGAGYLLLLSVEGRERLVRWGRVVTDDDPVGGQREESVVRMPRHGAAGRIGLTAVAVALIVPAAIPGFTKNVLGTIGHSSANGLDGPQSLGSGLDPFAALKGSLDESHTFDVLTVTSSQTPWYLRVTVLDQYTPEGWVRGHFRDQTSGVGKGMKTPDGVAGLEREGRVETIHAKIRITSYRDNRLPVYYAPTSVTGVSKDWVYDSERSEILATKGGTAFGQTYDVTAAEPDPSQAQLAAATQLSASNPVMRRWGQRPPVRPKVARITQNIIAHQNTPWTRANAINNYFTDGSQGFTYSLQTRAGTSTDALQNFLEQKQGYCEQYASAMAVMLRLAGVPSRVVLGYAQGTYDGQKNSWTITNHDAHAWVEAYFNHIGWVAFDPTPRDDGHTSPPPIYQQPVGPESPLTGESQASAGPGGPVNAVSPSATASPAAAAGGTGQGGSGGSIAPAVAGLAVAGLGLLALLASPALIRRVRRRRRFARARGPDAAAAARACWAELCDTMSDLGIASGPAESPRATVARVSDGRAMPRPAVSGLSILALAEERARYAAQAGVDADLSIALQAARRGLLSSAGRWRRGWVVLVPPSVMLGAAGAIRSGAAEVSAAIASLGRALRPRGAQR